MKAYELLSDPAKWTKNTFARDERNYPCDPNSPAACKWCAVGAIEKCYPVGQRGKALELATGGSRFALSTINDDDGYDVVIAMLKEANV